MTENKAKVAITLDADLLRRLEEVCELRGQSRSAVINRIIRNEIDSEEEFIRDMESPVMRTIMGVMVNTPGVMEAMAKVIGNNMKERELEEVREGLKNQAARGKERKASKKSTRKKKTTPRLA